MSALSPGNLSKEFTSYLAKKKRDASAIEKDCLKFDSLIESGNLDRVEALPRLLNNVQKYNLYCKVDTNTKGHQ